MRVFKACECAAESPQHGPRAVDSPTNFNQQDPSDANRQTTSHLIMLSANKKDTEKQATTSHSGRPSLKSSDSMVKVASGGWSKMLKKIKKFLASAVSFEQPPVDTYRHRLTPRVMLHGCTTKEEHYDYIDKILRITRGSFGLEGLQAAGFTYKFIPCEEHAFDTDLCPIEISRSHCTCDKRLVYVDTDTTITKSNLKQYVADGDMYEEITRLCQEYAQELMKEEGSLHWVSVCDDAQKGNPIRVLVDSDYPIHGSRDGLENNNDSIHDTIEPQQEQADGSDDNVTAEELETLLITTGNGKVRAGIFSRQHLLVSGIESSTALPMIRDAKHRGMSVAILDPNARGMRTGMTTYLESMKVLFGSSSSTTASSSSSSRSNGPMYVLAHSASGSQLARYLQTEGSHMLPRIKSIAFTDSTHSVQWLHDHPQISSFFQSSSTIYIRSSNECRDDDWQNHKCGDPCKIDDAWTRRFGKTYTIWAGTTEHSLTNFTSQHVIWEHFDRCRQTTTKSLINDAGNDDATNTTFDSGTCCSTSTMMVDSILTIS